MRNVTFDAVKGWLMILVIIGHISLTSIVNNQPRDAIYFFHMPLFIGITGYFIKKSTLMENFKSLYLKYYHRLILPFLIAFVFYSTAMFLTPAINGNLSAK